MLMQDPSHVYGTVSHHCETGTIKIVCMGQGLLEFLAAEPYYHSNVWQTLLEDPYRKGTFAGAAPLMSLLPSLLLRRTQHDVRKSPDLCSPSSDLYLVCPVCTLLAFMGIWVAMCIPAVHCFEVTMPVRPGPEMQRTFELS